MMLTGSSRNSVAESKEENEGALGCGSGDIDPREDSAGFIQC